MRVKKRNCVGDKEQRSLLSMQEGLMIVNEHVFVGSMSFFMRKNSIFIST